MAGALSGNPAPTRRTCAAVWMTVFAMSVACRTGAVPAPESVEVTRGAPRAVDTGSSRRPRPTPRPWHPTPAMPDVSLADYLGAELDGLGDMALRATVGGGDVIPLPKGEPGGRVVGRGKDIRGVVRLVRVKHDLSDWWADSGSLGKLAKWLNEKTAIQADMRVEGGAVRLTDANLLKSPILWMTGHDPAIALTYDLVREGGGGQKLDAALSGLEVAALRRYLVDKRGLLVFDDCGVNAPAQAIMKIVRAQLRRAMPEYGVARVPNDHPLYRAYYDLGGPPVGFDIFWWGNRPPRRNYLEGVSIRGKLVALLVRRDYLCAMRTVGIPGWEVNYSPGVMRWATNVVVYSLTTGGIADYKGYVPGDTLLDEPVPLHIPQAARIRPTPLRWTKSTAR